VVKEGRVGHLKACSDDDDALLDVVGGEKTALPLLLRGVWNASVRGRCRGARQQHIVVAMVAVDLGIIECVEVDRCMNYR